MNLFSPSETSDIVASVIAVRGAPVLVCGSCCDWDCCGALGCSCARSGRTGASRSATYTEMARRVVIRLDFFRFSQINKLLWPAMFNSFVDDRFINLIQSGSRIL